MKTTSFFLLFFCSLSLLAQDYDFKIDVYKQPTDERNTMRWGVVDTLGNEIIPCKYQIIGTFLASNQHTSNPYVRSLLCAEMNNKKGLVDQKGRVVVNFLYDNISIQNDDYIVVAKGTKKGFKDVRDMKEGEVLRFSCSYSDIIGNGNTIIAGQTATRYSNKYGLIDRKGAPIVLFIYDEVDHFYKGTKAHFGASKKGKWGVLNIAGKECVPFVYDKVTCLQPVYDESAEGVNSNLFVAEKDGKKGIVDITNKVRTELVYDDITWNREAFINVKQGDKIGVIDTLGNIVLPVEYDNVRVEKGGYLTIVKDKEWGLADSNGELLIPTKYADLSLSYTNGVVDDVVIVVDGRRYGMLNLKGEALLPLMYDFISTHSEKDEMLVGKGGLQSIYDKKGNQLASSFYQRIGTVNGDTLFVKNDDKWGVVTRSGIELMPFQYTNIFSLKGGLCVVVDNNDKYGMCNIKDKKELLPLIYDGLFSFNDGRYAVLLNGRWSFVNQYGEPLLSSEYDDLNFNFNKLIAFKKGDKWGFLDEKTFEEVTKPIYDDVDYVHSTADYAVVKNKIK